MANKTNLGMAIALLMATIVSTACRRVTIVSDSIVAGENEKVIEAKLNSNNGETWVYTKHV